MNDKWDRVLISAGLLLLSSLIYMHYVFKEWTTFESLVSAIPRYLLASLALGVIVSALRFPRPYIAAFALTAPSPIICALFYYGVTRAIAGVGAVKSDAL